MLTATSWWMVRVVARLDDRPQDGSISTDKVIGRPGDQAQGGGGSRQEDCFVVRLGNG